MDAGFLPYLQVRNLEVVGTCSLPVGCIGDTQITGSGGTSIQATKVQQQRTYLYSQDRTNNNVDAKSTLCLINGAQATIGTLKAKLPEKPTSSSTTVVTWKKNNVAIGSVTFTDADADNAVKTTAPSDTAAVANDDIGVEVDVTGATPGKGIMAYAKVTEYGS